MHVQKAETEAKFWIREDRYDIEESFAFNMSPQDRKEIRKLIFNHFDYIVEKWNEFQNRKK